jgi:hypothetical protein
MVDINTKKKLLKIWRINHRIPLSKELQSEFLNHPMVEEILKHDYFFAERAIVHESCRKLSEILASVKEKQAKRDEFLAWSSKRVREPHICLVCESEVIGLSCLCRAA